MSTRSIRSSRRTLLVLSRPALLRPPSLFAKAIDRTAGTLLGGIGAWFAFDGARAALR